MSELCYTYLDNFAYHRAPELELCSHKGRAIPKLIHTNLPGRMFGGAIHLKLILHWVNEFSWILNKIMKYDSEINIELFSPEYLLKVLIILMLKHARFIAQCKNQSFKHFII